MRLMERDRQILSCLSKFSFLLGRQLKSLFFDGTRACDRRLRILLDNEYIKREKILYGIPSLYSLSHKGKTAVNASIKENKIRVEQIQHDIAVVDTVIYFMDRFHIPFADITAERQLHQLDGFGVRKHQPDFIFSKDKKIYCVEVELSLKAKVRLEKIIETNFLSYDHQLWIVPDNQFKILQILNKNKNKYPIKILSLEREVQTYVKHN